MATDDECGREDASGTCPCDKGNFGPAACEEAQQAGRAVQIKRFQVTDCVLAVRDGLRNPTHEPGMGANEFQLDLLVRYIASLEQALDRADAWHYVTEQ